MSKNIGMGSYCETSQDKKPHSLKKHPKVSWSANEMYTPPNREETASPCWHCPVGLKKLKPGFFRVPRLTVILLESLAIRSEPREETGLAVFPLPCIGKPGDLLIISNSTLRLGPRASVLTNLSSHLSLSKANKAIGWLPG